MGIAYGKGWGEAQKSRTDDGFTELLLHFDMLLDNRTLLDSSKRAAANISVEPSVPEGLFKPGKFGMAINSLNNSARALAGKMQYLDFTKWDNATIEWWEYWENDIPEGGAIIEMGSGLGLSSWSSGCLIGHVRGGKYEFLLLGHSSSSDPVLNLTKPSLKKWTHYAIVKLGTTYKGYKDGVLVDTKVMSWTNMTINYVSFNSRLDRLPTPHIAGRNLDELRISSVARYLSNFTPPRSPFPDFVQL